MTPDALGPASAAAPGAVLAPAAHPSLIQPAEAVRYQNNSRFTV
jgi:hypothetical protein